MAMRTWCKLWQLHVENTYIPQMKIPQMPRSRGIYLSLMVWACLRAVPRKYKTMETIKSSGLTYVMRVSIWDTCSFAFLLYMRQVVENIY